jgi:hypothetical protein
MNFIQYQKSNNMKKTAIMSALICAMFACTVDDEKAAIFTIDGPKSFSVGKDGGLQSVPVNTTVDYAVTSSERWCTIVNKKTIGFKIAVALNETIVQRTATITVETPGFSSITLTVTQEEGVSFLTLPEDQRIKSFEQAGGEQTVMIGSNVEYTATSLESWCEVIEKNATNFKIMVTPNDGFKRETNVIVAAPGFPSATVTVLQAGGPILKNASLADDFAYWTVSGTPDLFAFNIWKPDAVPGKSLQRKDSFWGQSYEGRFTQTITGLPNGLYEFSCYVVGGGTDEELSMITIDKHNVETKMRVDSWPGDWVLYTMPVTVTEGECTVGIYTRGGTVSPIWFNVAGFNFE